jgi:ABC-type multidrug transport system fused ATPase/permease subunit
MFTDIIRAVHQSLSVLAAEKRPFYFAIFLCILGGGIELIGVGTLYPFLSLLSKPELIDSNATLHRLYAYGGFENVNRFLLWSGWLTLAVFFLTSVFMFLKNAYITRFCVRQTARVSVSMLEAYLRKPMLFHVESNSGALSKDVIGQTDQFTFGVLISVMTLFGDGAILIVLIGLILWVDFNVGLVVTLTLGLILSMALVLTRDKMHKLGVQNDNANSARFAFCVSALQSIKEIKTSGKESFFSGLFRIHAQAQARSYASLFIIQLLPPAIVQFIAAGAVISMALYYIASGVELSTIVPTLVLYAVAGYRLMPSVGKLANALSQLRQFQPVIGNISRVLNSASHSSRADPAQVAEPAILQCESIEFRGIAFRYPSAEHRLFDGLDLTIGGGSFVCFVGKSGSGKTTMVDLLLGLLPADAGAVLVNGKSMHDVPEREWRAIFGYVPQSVYIVDGTIAENIAFGVPAAEVDPERLRQVVSLCHLEDFVEAQPAGLNAPYRSRALPRPARPDSRRIDELAGRLERTGHHPDPAYPEKPQNDRFDRAPRLAGALRRPHCSHRTGPYSRKRHLRRACRFIAVVCFDDGGNRG